MKNSFPFKITTTRTLGQGTKLKKSLKKMHKVETKI